MINFRDWDLMDVLVEYANTIGERQAWNGELLPRSFDLDWILQDVIQQSDALKDFALKAIAHHEEKNSYDV